MSDFDPGPGWREVTPGTPDQYRNEHALVEYAADGKRTHVWVREVPVPALPTAPYTVIRVTWKKQYPALNDLFTRLPTGPGQWILWRGEASGFTPSQLIERITGFEVLSEPRAVTAKAVLDEFEVFNWDTSAKTVETVATTFGVKS